MATKRNASSDLNHDNWDREDEPEEAGSFKRASEDVIKHRVIKTARRRNPISSVRQNEDEEAKPNVFGGFTGFKKTPTPSTTAFSFLSNQTTSKEQPKTNGMSSGSSETKSEVDSSKTATENCNEEYLARVKGLNESVSKWIQKHVDTNPFINLTPIFKDYEKYLSELEAQKTTPSSSSKQTASPKAKEIEKKDDKNTGLASFVFKAPVSSEADVFKNTNSTTNVSPLAKKSSFSFGATPATTQATSGFSFGTSPKSDEKKTTESSFKFGASTPSTSTFTFGTNSSTSSSGFSFGNNSSSGMFSQPNSSPSKFSFSGSSPFTFKNTAAPPSDTTDKKPAGEEEEDEPPKVEFKPVEEEGHVYKIRCKVFVKKDGNFADRGVGNLFLKPIENSEKKQLIVRADTNLGNLLCNFILSDSLPVQRMGKKDVMIVCIPTAEAKPPPVPMLLRVKTTEEADELLKTLEKYKK